MRIKVKVETDHENLEFRFVEYAGGVRLWIIDPTAWWRTVGRFCPHYYIANNECQDCALNVE